MVDFVINKVLPRLGHPFWKCVSIVTFLLLCYLTLTPGVQSGINIDHIDKLFHFIAFAGVTFSMMAAFHQLQRRYIVFGLIVIGFVIEMIQMQIPGRDFSWLDWLADCAGVIVVALLFQKSTRILPQGS